MAYTEKIQVYLRKEELETLRKAAALSGRSVADLVREAIRKVVLKPKVDGPVAIWDGEPRRTSVEHDSIYDGSGAGRIRAMASRNGVDVPADLAPARS